MRPGSGLLWLCAGALWGAFLWLGGVPVVPWEVTLRPATAVQTEAPPTHLLMVVERTLPGLEGLAVGDTVQFDRYGILRPIAGSRACVPVDPGASRPVQITPLGGGRIPHEAVVTLALVPALAHPDCLARFQPLLSQ